MQWQDFVANTPALLKQFLYLVIATSTADLLGIHTNSRLIANIKKRPVTLQAACINYMIQD